MDKNEIQSVIHPDINFRLNSINLLIGGKGSGKTWNLFREAIKLSALQHAYTQLIYVTDKTFDDTYMKMKGLIKIPVIQIKYEEADDYLTKLVEAKEVYHEIVMRNIEYQLEDDYRNELLEKLDIKDFKHKYVHTIILYDDAAELFMNRKEKKFRMLLQNRQPKLTYFLCIQDPVYIDASIKSNLDTAWLFGGLSPQKLNYILQQLNSPMDKQELISKYNQLTRNQAIIFDYSSTGTKIKFIEE
jgi:hypothetical protein